MSFSWNKGLAHSKDTLTYRKKTDSRSFLSLSFSWRSGSSILGPLKRAFAQDQREVTRAAALDGIFSVSRDEARPYDEAALAVGSHLVQWRAKRLLALYQEQNNEEKSKR